MINQYSFTLSFIFLVFTTHTNDKCQTNIPFPRGFINLETLIQRQLPITNLLHEPESAQWIVQIPNGIVVDDGAILTHDGLIFEDTETYLKDQHKLLKGHRDITQEANIFFDGRLAVIPSPGQENWYHWLLQVIPRLKILVESGIEYDKIYVSSIPCAWQRESLRVVLEKLNIPMDMIIEGQSIIHAQELIVPSVPFIPSKNRKTLPHWLTNFIHDCFLTEPDLPVPQKIYISRSLATTRRISNEDELIATLQERGFVILHLEQLSAHEQARYFNQASIIIGPHGSGFANLIFSKPNALLIELDHGLIGSEQRSFYKKMAHLMDCNYHPFYVDKTTEEHLDDDLLIDIAAFSQFLNAITAEC